MDNNLQAQYQQPNQSENAFAIASLALGIISIVAMFLGVYMTIMGLICGILAIIFGVNGRKKQFRKGIATAGLVCGIVSVSLFGLVIICGVCAVAAIGSIASTIQ